MFTAKQIEDCLSQAQAGFPIEELSRKYGTSLPTFYHWRAKDGALTASELLRIKQIREELRRGGSHDRARRLNCNEVGPHAHFLARPSLCRAPLGRFTSCYFYP